MAVSFPPGFDFTDPDTWAERVPVAEFAELRRTAPIWWNPQPPGRSGFDDGGYWVVTKHEHVKDISMRPEVFSSQRNTAVIRYRGDMQRDQIDVLRMLLQNMDAPAHTQARRIVSKGFTPRAVESLRAALTDAAREIVREAKHCGSGDFVEQVACDLPLRAIADLLGVPQEDRTKLFDWSNQMMNYDDDEYNDDPVGASAAIMGYAWNLAEQRRACPADDIVTKLVDAEIDGEALSSEEFAWFVIQLAVAGNETTRNAITHGMKAFLDHPEQWELFKQHRPRTTADEIVRWATPVAVFQRTATADAEVGGVEIHAGQRVGMFYSSANFDDDVFDDPFSFDILRDPNPHVGFGGTGSHYCLGANLARLEIDLMFNALADAMPDIRQLDDPVRLRSGWLNGIKHWNVAYTRIPE
ncbi:MAG: cytochrome P450 [Mycobacteriaceae bacterium]|nr:cytochrome P450 [Mycobacteriaceae bacterium]